MADTRYGRQEGLFGREGQRRIQGKRVGIVGVGGIGSHVVQQLAYLGVLSYVFVDADVITSSSLNRLIGAVESDVGSGTLKVDVAKRLVASVQPTAEVVALALSLEDREAQVALRDCDAILGCLDHDAARLRLTEACSRSALPYIDLATDTGEDDGRPWYGGHMLFAEGGKRCPSCMGLLDQRAIAREGMTSEQRDEDDRLYGVDRSALGGTGPAVVSVNGVVASLGVTEFMAWATGLREPWPLLVYRADLGRVTLRTDAPAPDCYYCTRLWGADARPRSQGT